MKEIKILEAFTNNKQRMMELVYRAWDNISWKVMDKSWAGFLTAYGLLCIAGVITTTNRPIIREEKGKKIRVLRSILV